MAQNFSFRVLDLWYSCVDPNVQGDEERTPIFLAAKCDHPAVVEILASHDGTRADLPDMYGMLPVHVAARRGHLDVLKVLEAVFLHGRLEYRPLQVICILRWSPLTGLHIIIERTVHIHTQSQFNYMFFKCSWGLLQLLEEPSSTLVKTCT